MGQGAAAILAARNRHLHHPRIETHQPYLRPALAGADGNKAGLQMDFGTIVRLLTAYQGFQLGPILAHHIGMPIHDHFR